MKPILIYSGTTEGRRLAEYLSARRIPCIVCVATEYGRLVMPELPGVEVHEGRMSMEEMRMFAKIKEVCAVVDATHPFATEVTENIRISLRTQNIPYLRLLRDTGEDSGWREYKNVHWFSDNESCAKALEQCAGNILLTTGSKELSVYTGTITDKERLYIRVLPGAESLRICKECGMSGKHVIAMQGPFSQAMNEALILQYHIACLVTKESGKKGGFPEKMQAAMQLGIDAYVIESPKETEGYSFEEILTALEEFLGIDFDTQVVESWVPKDLEGGEGQMPEPKRGEVRKYNRIVEAYRKSTPKSAALHPKAQKTETLDLGNAVYTHSVQPQEPAKPPQKASETSPLQEAGGANGIQVALIGAGMGRPETMTVEAKTALEEADYVFGAKRLIEGIPVGQHPRPLYLPQEILPVLQEIREGKVAILFSGDTGFYSGCRGMLEALWNAGYSNLHVYPGISSVTYFAALCGISWQDAAILSIHGKKNKNDWEAELLFHTRYKEKTFVLVSGVQDLRCIGQLLQENDMDYCQIYVGYQLSYPQEQVLALSPGECQKLTEEGLYICLIMNTSHETPRCTHGFRDQEFLRSDTSSGEKVPHIPMTKEEVREVAISKLHLWEDAVVYDIGSGTGSIAVEIAARSAKLKVYAVEKKPYAVNLIERNCIRHHTPNVAIIAGEAPEILEELEPPTHAFIGGSSGNLGSILMTLYRKNPKVRVVLTAVSLETVAEMVNLEKKIALADFEVVQIQASRSKKAGAYHLMQAENPVYIASFTFAGEEK